MAIPQNEDRREYRSRLIQDERHGLRRLIGMVYPLTPRFWKTLIPCFPFPGPRRANRNSEGFPLCRCMVSDEPEYILPKMESMKSHEQDQRLRHLLRSGMTCEPAANPSFRASVWSRIEAGRLERNSFRFWLNHHLLAFAGAAGVCVVLFALGGGWLALEKTQRERDRLAMRYAMSIDAKSKSMAHLHQ